MLVRHLKFWHSIKLRNSYKVVQASFRKKFQCCHAPSKIRISDGIQKFREYGTVQNLNSKGLRDTYSVQRRVLRCKKH